MKKAGPTTKLAQEAIEKAKELEKQKIPTREEIVKIYKDGLAEAEKLQKLLKPVWFMHDTDAKKKASPTRKKKGL